MSSFYDKYQYEVFVLFGLVCIFATAWLYWLRHSHIGYGEKLVFQESTGTVWVASRLLSSEAHSRCIPNHSMLVSINGQLIRFGNREAFERWLVKRNLKKGTKERWKVMHEGKSIVADLTAERIFRKIPVYWHPDVVVPQDDWRIKRLKRYCRKTGQQYVKPVPSAEALTDIFFNR